MFADLKVGNLFFLIASSKLSLRSRNSLRCGLPASSIVLTVFITFYGAFPYQVDELTSILHSCGGRKQTPTEEVYPKNAHTDQNFSV